MRLKRIENNLTRLLNNAEKNDFDQGLLWYRQARLYSYELAKKYDFPFIKVCAIIAALSPRSRWERNKIDADKLIGYALGHNPMPKCGTYGLMVKKALKVIALDKFDQNTILQVLNGPKISAFFKNIYDGENFDVTVDSWIHLAAQGKYIAVKNRKGLNKTVYQKIEQVIKSLSLQLGIKPYETQAILWVTFKRLTNEGDFN